MGLIRLLFTLRSTLGRASALVRDARVPIHLKLILVALAAFIISPLNVLGDIPFLGFLDDAALLAFLMQWFVGAAGKHGGVADP